MLFMTLMIKHIPVMGCDKILLPVIIRKLKTVLPHICSSILVHRDDYKAETDCATA
jgi:hypothetical protein